MSPNVEYFACLDCQRDGGIRSPEVRTKGMCSVPDCRQPREPRPGTWVAFEKAGKMEIVRTG